MSTPCNSLNVQLIKVSKLASYTALKDSDLILTIESTGGNLYSRKSTLASLASYIGNNPDGAYSGSFTGSFKGKASGSFSGSFYGSATRSLTSSYLLQTSQNTTNQVGYFDGTRLKSAPGLIFTNNSAGVKSLSISSSLSFNYLVIAGRGSAGYNQAGISLANFNNNKSYPNYSAWTLLSDRSGSLTFVAPIGSNQFSSSGIVAKSTTGECYAMVQRRNGFYFWPYPASNTPARDGAIGIGVTPPNESTGSFSKYLRAKLQIDMFSGSGTGPWTPAATVENRATAILVNYGSGSATTSLTKTFFVSGSGNTYIHGKLNVNRGITGSFYGTPFKTLNGKSVSLWATSSHAVSSSFAATASFFAPLPGASTTLVRKNVVLVDAQGYGGTQVTTAHGCPSTPYSFILNWVAKDSPDNPSAAGFSGGEILSFDDVIYWGNDSDINTDWPGAAVQITGANLKIGWPNSSWQGTFGDDAQWVLNGNTQYNFDASKYKLKITLFY
jgi:hypothetical protein